MRSSGRVLRRLGMLALLAGASGAAALPITLKDSNGTRYNINTAVEPLVLTSNASGALTDATFVKSVTVTSFFVGFTPFFGFTTVFTIQRQVNVPLTNAFNGFNGLLVTAVNGQELANRWCSIRVRTWRRKSVRRAARTGSSSSRRRRSPS